MMIIRLIKTSSIAIFIYLMGSNIIHAQCSNGQLANPLNPNCNGTMPDPGEIIANFIPVLPILIGGVVFGILGWGAIQVMVAGDNDENRKKGIKTIQNAVIGVVILISSVAILSLIEAVFSIKLLYGVKF